MPVDVYGDGSAGDLTVSTDSLLSAVAPSGNLQFGNVTIEAGATLTVPSGTHFRCTGGFTNNGTLLVWTGAVAPAGEGPANPGISPAGAEAGSLAGSRGGQGLTAEQALTVSDVSVLAGGAGATTAMNTYVAASEGVSVSASGDVGGDGGGGLLVLAEGPITNAGTIQTDGGDASAVGGGGGGAGGIIILASAASIDNTGSILARGGDGGAAGVAGVYFFCPGGGGGGGLVRLLSPGITAGTVDVSGGTGGAGGPTTGAVGGAYGGAGGGGCGGNGGSSGRLTTYTPYTSDAAEPGDPGQVISTLTNPTALFY
jgi:hypothetical protein